MRRAWPALPAAFLVAASVYGLLAAVQPAGRPADDPWADAWERAGLEVHQRSVSGAPDAAYLDRKARATLKGPECRAAFLQEYDVSGFKAQVLELPSSASEALAGIAAEGEWKSRDGCTVRRAGRRVLAMATKRWVAMFSVPLPPEIRDRVFEIFRDAAGTIP